MKGNFSISKEELALLEQIIPKELCDSCLGRQLGKRGHGLTNAERGILIRQSFEEPPEQVQPKDCWLCEGLMDEFPKFAEMVFKAFGPYDYDTYLIGCLVEDALKKREKELGALLNEGKEQEELKSEINREVGKLVWGLNSKEVAFENPDILAVLDTRFDVVKVEVHAIYLYARYRKFKRGIPQTKWPCRDCKGKGCKRCAGTGKMYPTSVEEIIAAHLMELTKASGHALHGMGREDIDARMLGNGRPFVMELKEPLLRKKVLGDLMAIQAVINEKAHGEVEIEGLRFSSLKEIREIKDHKAQKSYNVDIEFAEVGKVDQASLEKAFEGLRGKVLDQRTPERVAHRRADLVRNRTVRAIDGTVTGPSTARVSITGDAGIYIKELITGDGGRTEPSLACLLGLGCKVLALDVVHIHDDEVTEGKK
jgi:tRNA pseudouridine synthase 10